MDDNRPDQATMIGLHKLAGEPGDGLMPELYAFLNQTPEALSVSENIVSFPAGRARLPRRSPHAIPTIARVAGGDNLLAFRQRVLPADAMFRNKA